MVSTAQSARFSKREHHVAAAHHPPHRTLPPGMKPLSNQCCTRGGGGGGIKDTAKQTNKKPNLFASSSPQYREAKKQYRIFGAAVTDQLPLPLQLRGASGPKHTG